MGKKDLFKILLRLTDEERELHKIFCAALKVSEYTDEVDNIRSSLRRDETICEAMCDFFTTVCGLSVISNDLPADLREKLKERDVSVKVLEPVLQKLFEIARRYKRLNPDKMRSEYGKMIMMLQDLARPSIRRTMGEVQLVTPLKTVGAALESVQALDLLGDSIINMAVSPLPAGFTPEQLAGKNKAHADLVAKYGGGDAAKAKVVDLCVVSIGDAIALIDTNRIVTAKLILWLDFYFRGAGDNPKRDLTIVRGTGGSMLSHGHDKQYNYVRESLLLWDYMQKDIFKMWEAVENDMIVNGGGYRIADTGQGHARMTAGPGASSVIAGAVAQAQAAQNGRWEGIQVIHMGDRDVPNPLVAIEKYTMIPRMLEPIVRCVEEVAREFNMVLRGSNNNNNSNGAQGPSSSSSASAAAAKVAVAKQDAAPSDATEADDDAAKEDAAASKARPEKYPGFRQLLLLGQESPEGLIVGMLRDFFRFGFCGSGDDGGSCIDGRSTSFYEWTTLVCKKTYYQCLLLTGFTGFCTNYNS